MMERLLCAGRAGWCVSPRFPTAAQRGSWLAHGKLSSETPSLRGTGVGVTLKGELWTYRLTGFLVRRLSLPRTCLIRDPGPKPSGLGPEVHCARGCSCFWLGCCGGLVWSAVEGVPGECGGFGGRSLAAIGLEPGVPEVCPGLRSVLRDASSSVFLLCHHPGVTPAPPRCLKVRCRGLGHLVLVTFREAKWSLSKLGSRPDSAILTRFPLAGAQTSPSRGGLGPRTTSP